MINVGNKEGYKRSLNARRKKIMDEMRNNPNITQEELVKIIGIKSTAIEDNIKFLKENEYIERKGSKKNRLLDGIFWLESRRINIYKCYNIRVGRRNFNEKQPKKNRAHNGQHKRL